MRRTSWTSATILGSPKCVWRLLTYAANDLPRKCMNRRGMCRTFHLVMTHQIEHQSQDGKKASHCQKSNMRKSYMSISSKFVLASCHTLDNWRFFLQWLKDGLPYLATSTMMQTQVFLRGDVTPLNTTLQISLLRRCVPRYTHYQSKMF